MSKLLKSKFLLGVMVVAALVLGSVASFSAPKAEAASCSTFTMTLRAGMKNSQVMCLQQMLNEKGYIVAVSGPGSRGHETMTFGPATKAAVKAFQAAAGLAADGIFGPMSRVSLLGLSTVMVSPSGLPAGCASTSGYSSVTGQSCGTVSMSLPAGCTSSTGYSATTGQACSGTSSVPQGTGAVSVSLPPNNPAPETIVAAQPTAHIFHFF